MMKCLACDQEVPIISNEHLAACSGLTVQEYSLRYGLPLDMLVPAECLNTEESLQEYPYSQAPDRRAKLTLSALYTAGLVQSDAAFVVIPGEIRKLDQLLWLNECLQEYGFQFRQEYIFNRTTHRVVAVNRLKARQENIPADLQFNCSGMTGANLLFSVSILAAVRSYFYGGYLFLELQDLSVAEPLRLRFTEIFNVHFKCLPGITPETCLLRTLTKEDTVVLLNLLKQELSRIPHAAERYYQPQPTALVAKELVFDSAHFITDHPDKCANLHGGRYNLLVKVRDQIDPDTGFVVDYGYLKAVVKQKVIDLLDHKSVNLADLSLGWRSSTELINLFIWEQLIDYLPNLYELQTYETAQSYCCFRGPSLDDIQERDGHITEPYFQSDQLGRSVLRRYLDKQRKLAKLKIV